MRKSGLLAMPMSPLLLMDGGTAKLCHTKGLSSQIESVAVATFLCYLVINGNVITAFERKMIHFLVAEQSLTELCCLDYYLLKIYVPASTIAATMSKYMAFPPLFIWQK